MKVFKKCKKVDHQDIWNKEIANTQRTSNKQIKNQENVWSNKLECNVKQIKKATKIKD